MYKDLWPQPHCAIDRSCPPSPPVKNLDGGREQRVSWGRTLCRPAATWLSSGGDGSSQDEGMGDCSPESEGLGVSDPGGGWGWAGSDRMAAAWGG